MKPGMKANWEFGVNPTTIIIIIIVSIIGGPLTALKIKFCAFIVNADLKSILNAKRAKMFTHLSTFKAQVTTTLPARCSFHSLRHGYLVFATVQWER